MSRNTRCPKFPAAAAAVTLIALSATSAVVRSARGSGFCTCPGAGTVLSQSKISATAGEFDGLLHDQDQFGRSVAYIGDVDLDGVGDLAVGAYLDNDGGTDRGAVWVLFLNADGTVKAEQKISSIAGDFPGPLHDSDLFGVCVTSLGDLDGDEIIDIAVGAVWDDDGGTDRGAVWILFLNADGTVKAQQKISGFNGLDDNDWFGQSVASLGDVDHDGIVDLAVGAVRDDDGGTDRGAVWVLFLNTNGTVKAHQKISSAAGGFTGSLDNLDDFGISVASLGDLDDDGITDIAAGAFLDDDGGTDRGAVWVLFLNTNGTVKSYQKISSTAGGFTGSLDNLDDFGISVASLGDLDGDGITDIAAGAFLDDDGGVDRGAVWVLLLNANGTVKDQRKISGFTGLDDHDWFGVSVASLGDLDNDGIVDLAVGASLDDDGGTNHGAVRILTLDGCVPTLAPLGDLDKDCSVDGADLGILLGAWGSCDDCAACTADLNGDCAVDGADLGVLLGGWG